MTKPFTIICPLDFSECSLNALEYATNLALNYQAKLILFHVINREDYLKLSPFDEKGTYQNDFLKEKLSQLHTAVFQQINGRIPEPEWSMREGEIVHEILTKSQEENADLIVIGTEGMNELRKNIVGSRASQVVEKAEMDVIVIPRKVFFKDPKKLIYATDYYEEDKLAVQKITTFARFFDAEIDIVHVTERQKLIDKTLHQVMIDELKPFVRYNKVNYLLKSFRDDLALGLENHLQIAKGDLLITLSKKKSFFERIFTESLSKKMAYFINKPLWVIKKF
ncbi:universal stress protein [Algoriphagus sp.]|uniref:universal stress protein n=1 Tax=Algoriphagus sp. TaxID=1872435 RepID=UPI0026391038|nr:universal stress protein [Algoriphagus sp.]